MDSRLKIDELNELEIAIENLISVSDNLKQFGVTPSVRALLMTDPVMKETIDGLDDDKVIPAIEGLMDKIFDKFKSIAGKNKFSWKTFKEDMTVLNEKIKLRVEKGRVTDDLEITSVDLSTHIQKMHDAIKRCEWTKNAMRKISNYKGSASDEEAAVMMTRLAHEAEQLLKVVELPTPSKTTCSRAGFPKDMDAAQEAAFDMLDKITAHSDTMGSIFRGIPTEMGRLWSKHGLNRSAMLIESFIPNILMSDLKASFKSVIMES